MAGRVWGPGLRLFFRFTVGGLLGGFSSGWWLSVGALRAIIIELFTIMGACLCVVPCLGGRFFSLLLSFGLVSTV